MLAQVTELRTALHSEKLEREEAEAEFAEGQYLYDLRKTNIFFDHLPLVHIFTLKCTQPPIVQFLLGTPYTPLSEDVI